MTEIRDWLPPLLRLNDHGGNWERYLEAIYAVFKQDFVDTRPSYKGIRLGVKKHPIEKGKEACFWHLISEGKNEQERIPDLRRCERIGWPRPMIEAADAREIKLWENASRGETRIVIALKDFSYVVILAKRKDYVLLWTAYCVDREHSRRKMEKECLEFYNAIKS